MPINQNVRIPVEQFYFVNSSMYPSTLLSSLQIKTQLNKTPLIPAKKISRNNTIKQSLALDDLPNFKEADLYFQVQLAVCDQITEVTLILAYYAPFLLISSKTPTQN